MVDTATAARVNRFTGRDGRGGGGLPLPDLWNAILRPLLDAKPAPLPDEVLLESVKTHEFLSSKVARIRTIYDERDPWLMFFDDAISQLHQRKLIESAEPRGWKLGPKFKAGESLTVIPAARGHAASTVTVRSTAERAASKPASLAKMGINELASKLTPRGGFRKIDAQHLDKLKRSIEAVGWRPELGLILHDQHKRILDGAHRFEALEQLDQPGLHDEQHRKEFFQQVDVDDDREALGIVWAANLSNAWSKSDADYFTEVLGGDPFTVLNSHERARVALKVDPSRTDRVIAAEIGVAHTTVSRERQQLASEGIDVRTVAQRRKSNAAALKAANPEMSAREVARRAGLGSHHTAQKAEESGQFGAELHQTAHPEPAPVHTSETPTQAPVPEPEHVQEPPAPAPRRKNSARLQYRLEGTMVNDAGYLVTRLAEVIPDPDVLIAVGLGLQKLGELRRTGNSG